MFAIRPVADSQVSNLPEKDLLGDDVHHAADLLALERLRELALHSAR
jgi:hypothetical protein